MNVGIRTAICVVGGFGMGLGVGYLITKSTLKKKYEDQALEEIREVKEYYRKQYKAEGYETPEAAAKTLAGEVPGWLAKTVADRQDLLSLLKEEEYSGDVDGDTEEKTDNVWDKAEEYAKEAKGEDPRKLPEVDDRSEPYAISIEQYHEENHDYDKVSLTYFEEDDTLVDENEHPIPDIEGTIGRKNLDLFGVESQDSNIVYIRRENDATDLEVVRNKRSYTEIVLGLPNIDKAPKYRSKKRMMKEDIDE